MRYSLIFHFGGAYVNVDGPYQTNWVQASLPFCGEIWKETVWIFGNEPTICVWCCFLLLRFECE